LYHDTVTPRAHCGCKRLVVWSHTKHKVAKELPIEMHFPREDLSSQGVTARISTRGINTTPAQFTPGQYESTRLSSEAIPKYRIDPRTACGVARPVPKRQRKADCL